MMYKRASKENEYISNRTFSSNAKKYQAKKKVNKGTWGMPRLSKAMKDVISCEKLGGGANNLRSRDLRMGQPDG